jgi:methyl-accepting chemotaxis protein
MFGFTSAQSRELKAKLAALDRVQAIIEFDLTGTILTANENFLATLGYSLPEIAGKHHRMFVEPSYANSAEYREFWDRLRTGEYQAAQFKRIGKRGNEIWIQASYNPIMDASGKPYKIVKFATDITRQKEEDAERMGQIAAIRKSQAVIEFTLDGIIVDANENFLGAVGYSLGEIKGQHHSIFVDPAYRSSPEYASFWQRLKNGEYQAAQYKRFGKGNKEIWIQASYNPIIDASGRPYKVIKFATDITEQMQLLGNLKKMMDINFVEIEQAVGKTSSDSVSSLQVAEATSSCVQAMAAATEELATSVSEISASMSSSRSATDSAFDQTIAAVDFTKRLNGAATAMGGIVSLISNIAGQINLLALNATIESARAGEAGRGFAVVAHEVKNLANQAAKATEQIGSEINGVQAISIEVVASLESIRNSVEAVRNNVVTTAAAVEEQSIVTRDISSNMQGTARAVENITENMTGISASVTQVSNAVFATRDAARVLAR